MISKNYLEKRKAHWDLIAERNIGHSYFGVSYQSRIKDIYRLHIPEGSSVLELGCGNGHLLASLKPSRGVGLDFSDKAISSARQKHAALEFIVGDVHDLSGISGGFDYIILSDLINDVEDVQLLFEQLAGVSHGRTRIIMNFYSRVWEPVLRLAQILGLARPSMLQNWLTPEDVSGLMGLAGLEAIKTWHEILLPVKIPLVSGLFNKFLVKLWPFRYFALTNFMVARPVSARKGGEANRLPTVSVIVPARNEAGNIAGILERTPVMGSSTELIFVEGHSKDDTYDVILKEMAKRPDSKCKVFKQEGVGKCNAVRKGFENASGDMLMILDADMTVAPEDLVRFYDALATGKGDFINGVRLVYPMEDKAMRFLNLLGNKFFTYAFTWLLGQSIKDTLCGTKVLWRADYERLVRNRAYFGEFDPFGDYDLLFGAAKLNLKIIDLPIRYRDRTYGTTQIHRWSHGWLLLKMVSFAARKIKFV